MLGRGRHSGGAGPDKEAQGRGGVLPCRREPASGPAGAVHGKGCPASGGAGLGSRGEEEEERVFGLPGGKWWRRVWWGAG